MMMQLHEYNIFYENLNYMLYSTTPIQPSCCISYIQTSLVFYNNVSTKILVAQNLAIFFLYIFV